MQQSRATAMRSTWGGSTEKWVKVRDGMALIYTPRAKSWLCKELPQKSLKQFKT